MALGPDYISVKFIAFEFINIPFHNFFFPQMAEGRGRGRGGAGRDDGEMVIRSSLI